MIFEKLPSLILPHFFLIEKSNRMIFSDVFHKEYYCTIAYQFPNMINFDEVDFSEHRF